MVKGSGAFCVPEPFFLSRKPGHRHNRNKSTKNERSAAMATTQTKEKRESTIAVRKRCNVTGTGLSHYILTDGKRK